MPGPSDAVWVVLAFAFGAVIGSFLNVVVWRLPRGESLVTPGSHCPHCNRALLWWENVPLVSFLALRARCRTCGGPIRWRYFWMELLTAVGFAVIVNTFGATPDGVALCLFAAALLAALAVDLEHYIIPDQLNAFALAVGVGRDVWGIAAGEAAHAPLFGWLPRSLVGGVACSALFVLVQALGLALFRRDAMGDGDVKLARAIGAMMPLPIAMVSFLFAVAAGAVLGGAAVLIRGRGGPEASETDPGDGAASGPSVEPSPWPLLLGAGALYVTYADLVITAAVRLRVHPAVRFAAWWEAKLPEEGPDFVPTPTQVPFGPFMVVGAMLALAYGQRAIDWYVQWAGVAGGT